MSKEITNGPEDDPLDVPASLLCKLGSMMVHADEFLSPAGHDFDRIAMMALIGDPEVSAWVAAMTEKGFLPVKRETTKALKEKAQRHRVAK